MTHSPPAGDAVALSFTGSVYTPPAGDQLLLIFPEQMVDPGPQIEFPVPPSLILAFGSRWQQGQERGGETGAGWAQSPAKGMAVALAANEAAPVQQQADSPWDAVATKDEATGAGWGEPTPADPGTQSPWLATRPVDPAPAPMAWDNSAQPRQAQTAALWGKPPSKDQDYAGPWFMVDTIGPEWRLEDHRNPPLWADQPDALSFTFGGQLYRPDIMPPVFFSFGGVIAPHPVQPKDAAPAVRWQQGQVTDHAPDIPWGEGRFERIKDNNHNVDYGSKVEPLPIDPPAPDDKESYLFMNTVNAVRLPDNEPLELIDISIELDMDSFTWQLSAQVANKAVLALIEPDENGTKDIKVTINGWDWVFMVTRYDAEKRFGSEHFRISGESRTRLLSAPYAPLRSKTEDSAISAVQAATAELTNTGFTLSWNSTETWATPDWILPGGTFSYTDQTAMEVIAQIATTAGAVVIPSANNDALAVQPRYRVSPWNWGEDTTPIDHAIPESMVLTMSVEWRPEPEYNAVYVSGINEGVAVAVQRQGSAGDNPAPDIVEDWLTATEVNTERGRNLLSEGGIQSIVTMDIPLTAEGTEPGLVLPGQLVQVMEMSGSWTGLCLATGVSSSGSGAGRVVQTLQIERHFGIQ